MFHKLCKKFSIVVSLSLSLFRNGLCCCCAFFSVFLLSLFWFIEFLLLVCAVLFFSSSFHSMHKHGWLVVAVNCIAFVYFRYDGIWKSYLWIYRSCACIFFFLRWYSKVFFSAYFSLSLSVSIILFVHSSFYSALLSFCAPTIFAMCVFGVFLFKCEFT